MVKGGIRRARCFTETIIWKNPLAVNPESSREYNLIDCSSLLKYHSNILHRSLLDNWDTGRDRSDADTPFVVRCFGFEVKP